MSQSTIAAGAVCGLMDLAVSKGACRAALVERSEVNPEDLADQDNRIPLTKYVALMRAAKELCNDPALALHYGEAVDLSRISIVGWIGRGCETMTDGLEQLNRYTRLAVEVETEAAGRFQLVRDKDGLWFVDTRLNPNDFPELTESGFARMICGTRREFGETPLAKAVHVTHADPGYRAEYERIFRAPVVFESHWNAMRIDDAWTSRGIAREPHYVFGIVSKHAEELLQRLESSNSTRGRVESLLMPLLHSGQANMTTIAAELGVSRATLYRRLKAEGVSFEKVLDELRHKMALHYLNGKKVSANETAYLVGFSDPSAFSRAFKRWTGTSPGMVRSRKPGR